MIEYNKSNNMKLFWIKNLLQDIKYNKLNNVKLFWINNLLQDMKYTHFNFRNKLINIEKGPL
jgi:hypothetical protein